MHYMVLLDGEEYPLELQHMGGSAYQVVVGGQALTVNADFNADGSMLLRHGHEVYELLLANGAGTSAAAMPTSSAAASVPSHDLALSGEVYQAEVLTLRQHHLRQEKAQSQNLSGDRPITSPMPGKVVTVLVKEGQTVAKGAPLLVVEAMKMENEIKAPKAGTVRHLTAVVGASVDVGERLCVVA